MAKSRRDRKAKVRSGAGGKRARSTGDVFPSVPRWLPPVLYGLLTLLLFRAFVFSDAMLYGGDTEALGYMARAFYADALREGSFPLWNPLLLGGMPFLDALAAGDSLYPTALLLLVTETYRALGWKLVLHVFAAGLFMFGWTRSLGASRAGALLAGLGYMLGPFFVTLIFPGHDGKMFVTALTPLLFWAMEWTFLRRGLLPYVAVSLVVALVILTTHFQMAYFLFGAAGIYYGVRCAMVWRGVSGEDAAGRGGGVTVPGEGAAGPKGAARPGAGGAALARFGLFLAASLVGAAAAGVQLVPAVSYVTEHSRRTATTTGADEAANLAYASSWSLHPEEVVSVLVAPEFVGNNAGDFLPGGDVPAWATSTYWGRNPMKSNHEYVGVVVLLLAGLSFVGGARRAVRWCLAGLGLAGLLYALGAHTPVWRVVYEVMPGVSLFRAPSMAIFMFGFAAATLAALGVDRLLEAVAGDEEGWRPVQRTLWAGAGVLVLVMLFAGSGALLSFWRGVIHAPAAPAAREAARPFIARGFHVAAVFGLAVAALGWAARAGHLPRWGLLAGLGLLVVVDLWRVDAAFVQVADPARVQRLDPNVQVLVERLEREPPFRLWKIGDTQDVGPAAFGVELAGGHHPNDLARYRELIGQVGGGQAENLFNTNVAALLNVKYVLWPTLAQGGELQGFPKVAESQLADGRVYESLYAFPGLERARLVGAAEVVPDEAAVERILEEGFDPATTAVLPEPPAVELPGSPVEGEVAWEVREPNRQRLRVRASGNALLVIADNWYPAWQATVDGEPAPVLRAYHTLRAVPLSAGEHVVELEYRSGVVRAGLLLSLGALALLAAVGAGSWARGRRAHGRAAPGHADDGG
ncbi:MAG: hypothetical protein KY453_00905 [Gemmatimonadetes bacterium]|nr:hypothetical protein [Gemmatimonadota bacterium]